jgi:hypothetical protein
VHSGRTYNKAYIIIIVVTNSESNCHRHGETQNHWGYGILQRSDSGDPFLGVATQQLHHDHADTIPTLGIIIILPITIQIIVFVDNKLALSADGESNLLVFCS